MKPSSSLAPTRMPVVGVAATLRLALTHPGPGLSSHSEYKVQLSVYDDDLIGSDEFMGMLVLRAGDFTSTEVSCCRVPR